MDIGIIGSGHIGGIVARCLAALGHQVRIATSRGPESLAALAAETGATASTVEQAARARDVVIVTIPQKAVPTRPRGLFAGSTAAIVDTGNYYPTRDGRIDAIEEGLTDSEWVAQVLGWPVVKAFNNMLAASLDPAGRQRDSRRASDFQSPATTQPPRRSRCNSPANYRPWHPGAVSVLLTFCRWPLTLAPTEHL